MSRTAASPSQWRDGQVHQPAVDEVLKDNDHTELTSILHTIYYDCLFCQFSLAWAQKQVFYYKLIE